MIRIVSARKLSALRQEAADLQERLALVREEVGKIREAATELRRLAAEAQAETGRARAAYRTAVNEAAATLRALKDATEHPVHGQNIRADIALAVVRREIGRIKAEGSPEAIGSVQILDWLLGPEPDVTAAAAARG